MIDPFLLQKKIALPRSHLDPDILEPKFGPIFLTKYII